jgi:hypothetical protein
LLTKLTHNLYVVILATKVQWKYMINCQSKSQKANGEITAKKYLLGIRHAHALAKSHCCYTTPAHMLSLHALQQRICIGVSTCLNTF